MRILYNDNEGLKILIPAINADAFLIGKDTVVNSYLLIAEKDVPSGIPFLLVNENDLPTNVPQETWQCEINQSNCDGIGLTKEEFEAKYPEYKGMAVQ
jgi:hypothetical protein